MHFFYLEVRLGRDASDTIAFNTALVLSTADLEVTLVTPPGVPAVGAEPVGGTIFLTPSDHLDGVATEVRSSQVLVDTSLVAHEVLIDRESDLNGAILIEILHDVLLAGQVVDRATEITGLSESAVELGVGAVVGAVRSIVRARAAARRRVLAIARREGVGVALLNRDTAVPEVEPGGGGVATIAAKTAVARAAESNIGRREVDIAVEVDANTIGHGLSGSESPAGAASALITDVGQRLALGPLLGGVEGLGESLELEVARGVDDFAAVGDLGST